MPKLCKSLFIFVDETVKLLHLLLSLLVKIFPSSYPDVQWYDIALYTIWAFFCWLTFPWFGFGYFVKYPVKREELDDEQKSFYDIFQEKTPLYKWCFFVQ